MLYLSNRFILLLGLQNSNSKPAKGTAVQDIRTLAAFNKNITYKFPPPIARNFMFFGLTLQHDARHIARSLLEGVAFRMRSLSEVLCEISEDIRQVRASGGFTRSSLWMQIITNAFNRELSVPTWGETSSLGAAFWAMLGTGAISSFESIGDLVELDRGYRPEADDALIYDRMFEIYKSLYTTISPSFESIAALQKDLLSYQQRTQNHCQNLKAPPQRAVASGPELA